MMTQGVVQLGKTKSGDVEGHGECRAGHVQVRH